MNISVVIVSYNSEKFIQDNLNSLFKQTHKFKQIIVIDNNSTDNSLKIINKFNNIEKVFLNNNLGYAKAANIGIKKSSSDLILIANSDIILDSHFNHSVIKKFEEDKKIALLSPLILRFDHTTIDSVGQIYSKSLYPLEIGYNKKINKYKIEEKEVFSVCGAATIFSRKSLEKLKIFNEYYDEDFFIFWEDFDIGWRANLYNLKSIFYPKAIVYHYRGGTLKKNILSRFSLSIGRSSEIKYHIIKNRYLTLIKNFRFKRFWWTIPFIFFRDILWVGALTLSSPKIIIKLLKSGKYLKNAIKKRKKIKENE